MAENRDPKAEPPKASDQTNAGAPDSMEDKPTPPTAPDADLRPLDPEEGSGQNLDSVQMARAQMEQRLAAVREETKQRQQTAEFEAMKGLRKAHARQQADRRDKAVAEVEGRRTALIEQRSSLQQLAADPASLAIEAALSAQLAEALQQDETIPGGAYVVDGNLCDANGRIMGKAPKE
jgi:hypothetical protein